MSIHDEMNKLDQHALDNPQPGDYWHERFSPYFMVVQVNGDDITVLSCMGGPKSYSRKHELNAKIENDDGTWSFDYSKSMIVNREWMAKAVKYGIIEGFVADVSRSDKHKPVVKEYLEYRAKILLKELKDLGPEVSRQLLLENW